MTKIMRHLFTFMLGIGERYKRLGEELNWLVDDERVIMTSFILPTSYLNGT